MIRAVLFDFDGVIVVSEDIHRETFSEMLSIDIPEDRWYKEFAGTGSRRIFARLLEETGKEGDLDDLVNRRRDLFNSYVGKGRVKEMPGLREFLSYIREKGLKTAIVSGGHTGYIKPILEHLGILDRFDFIVSADEIPYRKPDPRPFLLAANKLGVKPGECLVMEDSYSGCQAAKAAGMRLVWMRPRPAMDSPECDVIADDLTSPAIRELIGK